METTMIKVTVRYFAILREARGLTEETLETGAADAGALYDDLRAAHGFPLERKSLRVAVNDAFESWDYTLQPGDQVVFIPPVAGG